MTLPGDHDKPAGFGCEILVIGYGNTLRRDDGVGPKVAEAIAALHLPGVETMTCHQLTPEFAGRISQSRAVIFVDASVGAAGSVDLREVQASDAAQLMGHATDPGVLLGLARRVFGHIPPGWSLAVKTVDFGFGNDLSPTAQKGLENAVEQIKILCRRLQTPARP